MSLGHEVGPGLQVAQDKTDPAVFRQGYPWRVAVDLNEACNIQCTYCHIDALYGKDARDSRVMPPAMANSLLADADRMQVFDATLTGGEITIMPNFGDYIDGIRGLGFTAVQIITNGTRLTPALASELKDAGLARVSISIDGPEASHDKARGEGTWRRAWKGLENALDAGLPVNVISVLGMHNIDDWAELSRELRAAGVRSQNVSLMCRLGRAEKADDWLGVPEERLPEVRRRMRELEAELSGDTFFMHMNDGVMQAPGWSGQPTPLHAFQDRNPGIEAVVKVDGSVLRNRLYGQNRTVGNLATMSLSTMWQQDQTQRGQLAGVVGDEHVGALPALYHHYGASDTPSQANSPERKPTTPNTAADYIRVRRESWGTVAFDTRTFTIVDIAFKGAVSE